MFNGIKVATRDVEHQQINHIIFPTVRITINVLYFKEKTTFSRNYYSARTIYSNQTIKLCNIVFSIIMRRCQLYGHMILLFPSRHRNTINVLQV